MDIVIPFINQCNISSFKPSEALKLDIACNNWAKEFPYSPEAGVRLWHNGSHLFLSFEVQEEFVAATAEKDNDKVSKDSCVEFFVAFDDNGYYNIEANCTGKILMSHRKGRKIEVEYASPSILSLIQRNPSLGCGRFNCKKNEGKWELLLSIPVASFFKHEFTSFTGLKGKANLYKCGDNLPEPHYLSWNPVKTDLPDFHRPEFFRSIQFE